MIVEIPYKELASLLKVKASLEQIVKALDMFGTPVDEFDKDILRVEVFPNRVDMLSPEGIARSLDGFLGHSVGYPLWNLMPSGIETVVGKSKTRPFISFSSVQDVPFTEVALKSLMQLQEKLHVSIGRNRRKYSIGVYDTDKIGKQVTYKEMPLKEIEFKPIGEKSEMTGYEILESTEKGMDFAHLLGDTAPVLMDEKNRIMAMAPITGADYCKVTKDTKNFFVDSTGTEKGTDSVVTLITTSLVQRGGSLGIVVPGPTYLPRRMKLDQSYLNKITGLNLTKTKLQNALLKMRFGFDGDILIPSYRFDIFNKIDIAEDIAIAHGYTKFKGELPPSYSPGESLKVRELEQEIRKIMTGMKFIELKTYMLTSPSLLSMAGSPTLEVTNPKSSEYSTLRQSLLPGLFDVLSINTNAQYPHNVFELGHIFTPDEKLKLSGIIAHTDANFAEIKAVVDRLVKMFSIKAKWELGNHPFFMEGRTALSEFGVYGEVSPAISEKFGVPLAAFELNLERIL